jgi:1-acyl-sn-glycerol-3-phosphate acyltransferase
MVSLVKLILRAIFSVFYRASLEHMENVPVKGPALLCANHIGIFDMLFIGYKMKRLVHWMAKVELFRVPVLGPLLWKLGAFPIRRGKADVESIKTALSLLNEGHIVGIFPQGTRIGDKDWRQVKVKRGAALLAVRTGVPIIPVAIKADYKLFSKVQVIFGEPFNLDIEQDKKYTNNELSQISYSIIERIYGLMEEK